MRRETCSTPDAPSSTAFGARLQASTLQGWDASYHRTHKGWLYLTVVIDLYSRCVVSWSMKSTMATELVLDALMMAVGCRQAKTPVMIHSDQGSPFGSDDFNRWCKDNQLVPSMSRRGNY
jgi:putative transposase